MDFTWALPYPEIHKICILFERSELSNPKKWFYSPLQSHQQEGPQCGLVALAMLIKNSNNDSINIIYQYAKKEGFTLNGEIFSVNYMKQLAVNFLKDREIEVYSGPLNSRKIEQFLFEGGALLVPYDTDKDNSPGLHNGHKAHWCVISGAVQTENTLFVLARHGKSKNIAIWNIDILSQSNQQLHEFSPDRKLQNIEYMLPEGGISGPLGLNGRSILIHPKNDISTF